MPGGRVASGERVELRTVEEADVEFILRESVVPEVRYPLGSRVRRRDEFDVSSGDADRFLVCLPDAGEGEAEPQRIGAVNVMDAHYKRPELGFWLVPDVHGEGFGGEAVALAVEYAFREYPTPALGAQAFAVNDASRGLLESLGFEEEGRLRDFMFVDGAHRDMVQYGLHREVWESDA